MTIVLGWWLLPTFITLVSIIAAAWYNNKQNPKVRVSGNIGDGLGLFIRGLITMGVYGCGIIVSLVSFLIYFIVV